MRRYTAVVQRLCATTIGLYKLSLKHGGMIASEFGESARRPASEIGHGAGDRLRRPARALVSCNGEKAVDEGNLALA